MIKISSDIKLLNIEMIHAFLVNAYWSKGRTKRDVEKTIENCLCFGLYDNQKQIGFARICTDYTVFAYVMDVFVLPENRGNGYAKQLMKTILEEPKLQSCQVWMLKTNDAHGLYKELGFTQLQNPEKVMERILK